MLYKFVLKWIQSPQWVLHINNTQGNILQNVGPNENYIIPESESLL